MLIPEPRLAHIIRLTDSTGMLQHSTFDVPNYKEGYSTDDNARGLVLCVLLNQLASDQYSFVGELSTRYLAYLWHAFDDDSGRFRNFLSYDRRWREAIGSEECHARALWGLGSLVGRSNSLGGHGAADQLFRIGLPAAREFRSPRAWAFSIMAAHEYSRASYQDGAGFEMMEEMAGRLLGLYESNKSSDWLWYEDSVTYFNARLPHALLLSGEALSRDDMIEVGLITLSWLEELQTSKGGHFSPIGNNGFYRRGGEMSRFDQQPIEAHTMFSACLRAFRLTNEEHWSAKSRKALEWFLGMNDLKLSLFDSTTGGCRDGLHPDRANENQGAESTLCLHMSLAEYQLHKHLLANT